MWREIYNYINTNKIDAMFGTASFLETNINKINEQLLFLQRISWIITVFGNIQGFGYNLTFGLLIIIFTYFYTAIQVNTNSIADDLKRNGGFVPGIIPGAPTAEFLDTVLSRITFPGSLLLALIAVLPAVAMVVGLNTQWAYFYGGTSLLITVGVILDTLQQVESYLLNRHYDGLMKTGKLRGRTQTSTFG